MVRTSAADNAAMSKQGQLSWHTGDSRSPPCCSLRRLWRGPMARSHTHSSESKKICYCGCDMKAGTPMCMHMCELPKYANRSWAVSCDKKKPAQISPAPVPQSGSHQLEQRRIGCRAHACRCIDAKPVLKIGGLFTSDALGRVRIRGCA